MYFKGIRPLNESFDFCIKNLIDLFTLGQQGTIEYTVKKMDKSFKEFNKYYKLDKEEHLGLIKAINNFNSKSKENEVIDFDKIDRFHHVSLNIKEYYPGLKNETMIRTYAILYKTIFLYFFPGYATKYTLPIPVDDRFIVFVTFDENKVDMVTTLTSLNQMDVTAPVYLEVLKGANKIFTSKRKSKE